MLCFQLDQIICLTMYAHNQQQQYYKCTGITLKLARADWDDLFSQQLMAPT